MMLSYFENLEASLLAKIQAAPDRPNARRIYGLQIARLGQRLFSESGAVAWCGVATPFDLLNTMDVSSCFVEFVGAMLASTGAVADILGHAERIGFSTDSCAYHRGVLGAADQGLMPKPDFLVGTSAPCTGGMAVLENLAAHFQKDLYLLHLPYEDSPENLRYLADRIRDLADFVAAHTGKPLDPERLSRAVALTNRAREISAEIYGLAARVPSPLANNDLKDYGIVTPLFWGTEAAVEIATAFKNELSQRISSGKADGSDERFRLLWIQNRIQFQNPLMKILQEDFRAKIVIDELNSLPWDPIDPDDPFLGMAKRMCSLPLHGPTSKRLSHLKKLCAEYRVHAAINPCHWGCRQGTGSRGLIQRGLNEIGVPVLNLEVDCVDPRNFAHGQLRTRLEAFFEMLG